MLGNPAGVVYGGIYFVQYLLGLLQKVLPPQWSVPGLVVYE